MSAEEGLSPMDQPLGAHSKTAFAACFSFLRARDFWLLLQFALRLSLLGVLLPSLVLHFLPTMQGFFTLTYVLSGVLISASMSVGQMNSFMLQYAKASLMWLPLSLLCVAVKLNRSPLAWFVVYVVLIFLLAFLNVDTTRRVSLLLVNVALVTLLGGNESIFQPFVILANWATGMACSTLTIMLPYPILAARDAVRTVERIFEDTATCFAGMLSCFWAENNTERSMFMVRIRYLVRSIDFLIEELETHNDHSFYEILIFDTYERYEVRQEKAKLLWKLKMNLRTLERVINSLQERPEIITNCARSSMFKNQLSSLINEVKKTMGELLRKISRAKTYEELRNAHSFFENTGISIKRLQDEFEGTHKTALYENEEEIFSDTHCMEEFFPNFSFFIFSIVNFWTVLDNFNDIVNRHKGGRNWRVTLRLAFTSLFDALRGNIRLVRNLLIDHSSAEFRIFIEAVKVSLAMLLSVIFFYSVNAKMLLLSGPTIIAFVSGMNPVETVHASGARLTGILIGSVIGFFLVTLFTELLHRIISICVIVFTMSFMRLNIEFSPISGSCAFAAMTLLSSQYDGADYTISRIQQNAFSIFIYCLISVTVFPMSPGEVLYEKRLEALKLASQAFKKIMGLMYEASSSYKDVTEKRLKMKDQDPLSEKPLKNSMIHVQNATNEPLDHVLVDILPNEAGGIHSMTSFAQPPLTLESISKFRRVSNEVATNSFIIPVDFNLISSHEDAKKSDLYRSLMPHVFFKDQEDTKIVDILDTIFEMLHLVLSTRSIMHFAANEFSIFPKIYPNRATLDVHNALYRLCVLLYTMACSWERMRAKGYFTEDMIHVFHNLTPLAIDLTEFFERFVFVCDLYVRNPSPVLCSELMKGISQFRAMCLEMSVRTEYDLLEVIRKVISEMILAKYKAGGGKPHRNECKYLVQGGGELNSFVFSNTATNERRSRTPDLANPSDLASAPEVPNATMVFKALHGENKGGKPNESLRRYGERPQNGDKRKKVPKHTKEKTDAYAVASSSTYFSTNSTCGSSESNFIQLDNSFVMPTTALDLEGLHTFTLTLTMFGRELRKVLFGLEEMLQSP
ncbi:unnamed protein product [Phytomonas sp. Hart1]|nr:unnamed protein product [Phytomonas sp. Hart1]|eukprot:CCW70140.1 unnamed protein product [Phytomonas sp. isolate Hart1]